MAGRAAARGFSLIELLVVLAIGATLASGLGAVLVTQAQQYRVHHTVRGAQAGARQALALLEQHLRAAGYGVDPDRALLAYDGFDPANPDGPSSSFPDAITVHARDRRFRRTIIGVGSAGGAVSLTVSPGIHEPLYRGQIVLALCPGGQTWAFATVGTSVTEVGMPTTTLQLEPGPGPVESPLSFPGALFHEEARLTPTSCFAGGEAVLTLVHRASFYLDAFDDDGDPATPRVPYLMLNRGLDVDGSGRPQASPVAAGLEQLQVAYLMNSLDASAPAVLGVNSTADVPWGEAWQQLPPPQPPHPDRPRWWFDEPYDHPNRLGSHPANIRGVRVTLVARTDARDPARPGDDLYAPGDGALSGEPVGGLVPWRRLENLPDTADTPAWFRPDGNGYGRVVHRLAVTPKNLLMRTQFLPPGLHGG